MEEKFMRKIIAAIWQIKDLSDRVVSLCPQNQMYPEKFYKGWKEINRKTWEALQAE